MKRSEMLGKPEGLANDILTFLERQGMHPPSYKRRDMATYFVEEWEEESEVPIQNGNESEGK